MSLLLPPLLVGVGWALLVLQPADPASVPAPCAPPVSEPGSGISASLDPSPRPTEPASTNESEGAEVTDAGMGPSSAHRQPWRLISRSTAAPGEQSDGQSGHLGLSLSRDGTVVAFASDADDLIPGDLNGRSDVFLYDTTRDRLQRITRSPLNSAGPSLQPSLSADGDWLAFTSFSRGLQTADPLTHDVPPVDSSPWSDIFLWSRLEGSMVRISATVSGSAPAGSSSQPSLSGDGRWVVYTSAADDIVDGDDNGRSDVLLYDRQTGRTRLISASVGGASGTSGNGHSHQPIISGDGHVVAFVSAADDLVSGDNNATADIFVHDLTTGVTVRIDLSVADRPFAGGPGRAPSLSLSWDGSALAFVARNASGTFAAPADPRATPISRVYLTNLLSGQTTLASVDSLGAPLSESCSDVSLSHDGKLLAFSTGLAAPYLDVLLFDRCSGRTSALPVEAGEPRSGDQWLPRLAGDGSRLALVSSRQLNLQAEHEAGDVLVVPLGPNSTP